MIKQKLNNLNTYITVTKQIYENFDLYNNKSLKQNNPDYKYEILLMSNSNSKKQLNNLIDWIYWHLNVVGIDHIIFVHNNCKDTTIQNKFKNVCDHFKQVDYYYEPVGSQSLIYNKYLPLSKSKYTICIDEDEYIYIKNKKIQDVVFDDKFYKFGIPMVNFYANSVLKDTQEPWLNVFKYICQNEQMLTIDDFIYYKVLVNNSINHYIINSKTDECCLVSTKNEKIMDSYQIIGNGLVHNPCSILNGEYLPLYNMYYNKPLFSGMIKNPINVDNTDIFIAHYKYRTESDYTNKIKNNQFSDVSNWYYQYRYILNTFYKIYSNANKFMLYDNLSLIYDTIKSECEKLKEKLT